MEERLSFVLKLSLEEMALRRVVVNLWNESDILPTIQNFQVKHQRLLSKSIKYNKEWRNVEKKVKIKVSKLVLPESLKENMLFLVRPIGYQILRWKSTHREFQSAVPEKLCWTSTGEVDSEKTAKKIVRLETFDVVKRYELACLYCLEDYIRILWSELPNEYKKRLRNKLSNNFPGEVPLEVYWAYTIEEEKSELDFIDLGQFTEGSWLQRQAFKSSARVGNKIGAEYIFQKLTNEDGCGSLLEMARYVIIESRFPHYETYYYFRQENISDVLCYLLTMMSPEQQMQVFRELRWEVLRFFLVWPWQHLFWDVAELIWTFLPERYNYNIYDIFQDINIRHYFPNLIQTFSLSSLNGFKNHFVHLLFSSFPEFFYEDPETVKVFLRNINPVCRARLVLDSFFLSFLDKLMSRNKWHLVKVCVREAVLTKEDRERLRQAVLKDFHPQNCEGKNNRRKRKLTLFYELLEEIEASALDK